MNVRFQYISPSSLENELCIGMSYGSNAWSLVVKRDLFISFLCELSVGIKRYPNKSDHVTSAKLGLVLVCVCVCGWVGGWVGGCGAMR